MLLSKWLVKKKLTKNLYYQNTDNVCYDTTIKKVERKSSELFVVTHTGRSVYEYNDKDTQQRNRTRLSY